MRVGRAELMRRPIWAAEGDWNVELAAGHRQHVGRIVDDLIESDQRETECHELDDRAQPHHSRTYAHSGETIFADRRVDDPSRPETLEQSLADFIGTLVFGDLLSHQKNIRIALQLLRERFVESLTIRDFSHGFVPLVAGAGPPSAHFSGRSAGCFSSRSAGRGRSGSIARSTYV